MRWKAIVAYDGTDYNGWQSQNCRNTIQDVIEKRLAVIFKKEIRIHGSGRTDSGVHARGQVFHFDADWKHSPEKLLLAITTGSPETIQIKSIRQVAKNFHARFSAKRKKYCYQIYQGSAPPMETRFYWSLGNRKLDIDRMRSVASILIGEHDFTSFSAENGNKLKDAPNKLLSKLEIRKKGSKITITMEANGFLYKMARRITGALVDVGCEKVSIEDIQTILHNKKHTSDIETAPPKGLSLERAYY